MPGGRAIRGFFMILPRIFTVEGVKTRGPSAAVRAIRGSVLGSASPLEFSLNEEPPEPLNHVAGGPPGLEKFLQSLQESCEKVDVTALLLDSYSHKE